MSEIDDYSTLRRWLIVGLSGLIQVLTMGAILSLTVFLEPMKDSLGVNYEEISLICSLSAALCQGLGSAAALILSLTGYRLGIVLGGLGMAASLMAAAFMPSYIGVVILFGPIYGFACSIPVAAATIIPGFLIGDSQRHIAYSIVFTGAGIGMMLFPPLYQFLIEQYQWRGAVIILAGISLNICAFAILFPSKPEKSGSDSDNNKKVEIVQNDDDDDPNNCESELKFVSSTADGDLKSEQTAAKSSHKPPTIFQRFHLNLWCQPKFLALWLATFFLQFTGVGIGSFLFNILLETFGVEPQTASFILTMLGVSSIFGRLSVMLLQKSTLVPRWCIFSLVCCLFGIVVALLGQFEGKTLAMILYATFGFVVGIIFPLHSIILTDLFPLEMLPSTYGYTYLALGIGSLTGPPLAGRLRDYSGNYQLSTLVLGGALALIHIPIILGLPFIIFHHRRNSQSHRNHNKYQDATGEGDMVPLKPYSGSGTGGNVKTPKIVITSASTGDMDTVGEVNGVPIIKVRRRAEWR